MSTLTIWTRCRWNHYAHRYADLRSIGHAIGLGLTSYTVVKLLSGKAKDVSVLTYVISVLFLIKFFSRWCGSATPQTTGNRKL